MGLFSRRPTRVPLLTKRHRQLRLQCAGNIATGPWMSGRELPDRMNPDFSFITSMVVSGYAICQVNSCSLLYSRPCTGWWWKYYPLGDVLMSGSGTRSCGRTNHEICELSEHHCGSVAPLHGVCLPNWKWNLPAGQRPMSQGSDYVGVVRGAY
ncbi:hypothetical protein AVEN_147222-1 [Araneus ventricosus]|uniref:Uncharacterized protein n=1 Tax=Araneus ventricosus TaxID=182803 RepID=A0A4Y2SFS5_ARAVE|nr:hypothetical protein AVEN_147222-1 [Araneus ventricosus]